MGTVSRILQRGRRGFVLPMSLVATFITLMIVGASARYCTTQLRTSQEYLSRTRCRLAAQSAIEMVKVQILEECKKIGANISAVNGGGTADLKTVVGAIKNSAESREEILSRIPGAGSDLSVSWDVKEVLKPGEGTDEEARTGKYLILATARTAGPRATSVTLQECIDVPLSNFDLFCYAYFADGDGHLISRYLTVNGDVRCNGKFRLSGAEVNGFIYAHDGVELATKDKMWFDYKDVTACTPGYYNRTYRAESDRYAKVRPTDPLGNGDEWIGGYQGIPRKYKKKGPLGIFTWSMSDSETPPVMSSKTWTSVSAKDESTPIVVDDANRLTMPKITDANFGTYKSTSGGSLVCSNCYVTAAGKVEQLSATLRLKATVSVETTVTTPGQSTTYWTETARRGNGSYKDTTGGTSGYCPPNGIPVYRYKNYGRILIPSGWEYLADENGNAAQTMKNVGYANPGFRNLDEGGFIFRHDPSGKEYIERVAGFCGIDPKLIVEYLSGSAQNGTGQDGWRYYVPEYTATIIGRFLDCYDPDPVGFLVVNVNLDGSIVISYVYGNSMNESWKQHTVLPETRTSGDVYAHVCKPASELSAEERNGGAWKPLDDGVWNADKSRYFTLTDLDVAAQELANQYAKYNSCRSDVNGYFNSTRNGWKKCSATSSYYYKADENRGVMDMDVETSGLFITRYSVTGSYRDFSEKVEIVPERIVEQNHFIPVYEWRSSRKDSSWVSIGIDRKGRKNEKKSYESGVSKYFIFEDDLAKVAAYQVQANRYTYADGKKVANRVEEEDISNLFGRDDNWDLNCSTGYRSPEPIGYFQINVTELQVDGSGYNYLTYAQVKEMVNGDLSIEKKRWTEETPGGTTTRTEEITVETNVVRQLRRVFVKDGYKVVANTGYRQAGATEPLVRSEDLVLSAKAGDVLKDGDTTEKLRPFMEDGLKCNQRTSELGTGGKSPDEGAVILIGTWDYPIVIDGPVVFESDVLIRGFVTGRGTIYSGRNIHIIGDICYKNPPFWPYVKSAGGAPENVDRDMLILVSKGSIVVGNYVKDEMWTDGILGGHYIDGNAVSSSADPLARTYTETNYKDYDPKFSKVKYDKTSQTLTRDNVRYYESVVGDYVFISENDSARNGKPATGSASSLTVNGCDCRLSQFWDCNPYYNQSDETCRMVASFQCSAIEQYANGKNWPSNYRVGTGSKSFRSIWSDSSFHTLCNSKFAESYSRFRSNWWSGTKPCLSYIQSINAVLYASAGIYGVIGGYKTPVVINGAIIGQDEALLPFVRNRRRYLFSSVSEDLSLTLNWDIRLNPNARDRLNGSDVGWPRSDSAETTGDVTGVRVLSWQEVPDSFNEEYHATP